MAAAVAQPQARTYQQIRSLVVQEEQTAAARAAMRLKVAQAMVRPVVSMAQVAAVALTTVLAVPQKWVLVALAIRVLCIFLFRRARKRRMIK